ncbi:MULTISPECIES: hypothetical protein [unclassified Solwaraspora]|uniref:hypothetical protein n=1 Tax=unclassified Solwaraspora TaxID=2627926 RepID=UPI00259B12DA|nr:hypothetical protein [Solwaraspora sp. WMMA2056]WJK38405.1 hypothetical protein O7608_18035 [Solwaraspora sp. WMMA2056]
MLRDRMIACLLFAVAFFGLVMQWIYPFSDIPEVVGIAITVVAVVSALTGVRLWLRSSRQRSDGDDVEMESDGAAEVGSDAGASGSGD